MIHVYTGNGKGKTSAAVGLALRSLGWGKKVALLQFLKLNETGEINGLARFENCQLHQLGTKYFVTAEGAGDNDRRLVEEGCREAETIMRDQSADLLILDEINDALQLRLVKLPRVMELIEQCPPGVELVLTGRGCPRQIISRADYVSEIKEVKHPYRNGVTARRGIEY